MKILGIDPGTATTGWAIIESVNNEKPRLIVAGIITTDPKQNLAQRLIIINHEINHVIEQYQPEQMAIEKVFFARNVTTAISVSHARGVTLLAAAQKKLSIFEYTPLQVKAAIVGYGRATKDQINLMLNKHLAPGIDVPKQDDAADAIAVAVTHLITQDNNMLRVIQSNQYQDEK